ncbi:ribonuclease III [Mycoplasma iguanae]|uniref:Ribonuclease 3 n=1 Tax=Mycoplasma iguanae TaxID=292461 RepID=A0ABY5R8Z4_9MOLU|nr:ribonuclease III [Mycoplasma iguanae]UVD81981.1 ribonuclease III [Mycoplasma iguanae]
MNKMEKLFQKIAIQPNDLKIFQKAFTHKSFSNSYPKSPNYNMLEFLGDSILQFKTSNFIYHNFFEIEEGEATLLRAKNVNTKALSELATALELTKYVRIAKNSEPILQNPKIQADLFESLVAAIYLDQGDEKLEQFLERFFYPQIKKSFSQKHINLKDPKTTFQEYVQHFSKKSVQYIVTKSDEDGQYHAILKHENQNFGRGIGKSKKEAETNAALEALTNLKIVK